MIVWKLIFEGIVARRNEFDLPPEMRSILRPTRVGFAQQKVGFSGWKQRWLEMMPYGELCIFGSCPTSSSEVITPVEINKVSSPATFLDSDSNSCSIETNLFPCLATGHWLSNLPTRGNRSSNILLQWLQHSRTPLP